MSSYLRASRIEVLEFEYAPNAGWWATANAHTPRESKRDLHSVLSWLDELEYDCFFEGNSGCLAPALVRPCDTHAAKKMPHLPSNSNIYNLVCSSRARKDILAALWKLADQCLSTPLSEINVSKGVVALGVACAVRSHKDQP